jgi:hypothetical protein
MRARIFSFIVILTVGGCVVLNILSCGDSKAKKKKEETEQKSNVNPAVLEMAVKHNAITDWGFSEYSFQMEDALIRKDGQPILFYASIKDIRRKNGSYYVHCSTSPFHFPHKIDFILECDENNVKKILSEKPRPRFMDNYAVIASISSVQKADYEIICSEGQEIVLDSSFVDVFIARGICLDLLYARDVFNNIKPKK